MHRDKNYIARLVPDLNLVNVLKYHLLSLIWQHLGVLGGVIPLTNQILKVLDMAFPRFIGLFRSVAHKQTTIQWVSLPSAAVASHPLPSF